MPNPPSRANARFGGASRLSVACIVATVAFWAYTQTLLPGVDLGDTGGFQAAVLWPEVSARQAYPLYYGLARPFVLLASPSNPARALNLFSALWAAVAVGLLAFLCATVTRSLAAGAVAGTLLAFSYTFWTQAIIAEVYSLHLALIGFCLVALYAYAARPSTARLLLFFAVYAAAFGNHLTMILLIVPFTLFLLHTAPRARDLFRPAIVAAALLIAAAGAIQYAPNFLSVWSSLSAPDAWAERVAAFWFDTTKQDWRDSMVLGIRPDQAGDRLAMWWFDARQQFGIVGLALAALGAVVLWRISRPWAVLVVTMYAAATLFALTYNVGDAHVFFLPAHYVTAFAAGAAVAWVSQRAAFHGPPWRGVEPRPTIAALCVALALGYSAWRGWSTWPAVDRHSDRRGEQLIASLTRGVSDRNAVFVSEMNWQLENVLLYTARHLRPDLAWVRLGDVAAHWTMFAGDNETLGRDLVLNGQAAAHIAAAFGPAFPLMEDPAAPVLSIEQAVRQVPRGAPYVLAVLTPPRESRLDPEALQSALSIVTDGNAPQRAGAAFEVFAGIAGSAPAFHRASQRPFTAQFRILDERFTARMESWLPFDTFRRAGFGHVLRGRERLQILERGVNLVWLRRDGTPAPPYYGAGLFAAQPRFRIPAATLRLARDARSRPPSLYARRAEP